jgi:hypothetical protein
MSEKVAWNVYKDGQFLFRGCIGNYETATYIPTRMSHYFDNNQLIIFDIKNLNNRWDGIWSLKIGVASGNCDLSPDYQSTPVSKSVNFIATLPQGKYDTTNNWIWESNTNDPSDILKDKPISWIHPSSSYPQASVTYSATPPTTGFFNFGIAIRTYNTDNGYLLFGKLDSTPFYNVGLSSISINPTTPKSGDSVQITNTIVNKGSQSFTNIEVTTNIAGPNAYTKSFQTTSNAGDVNFLWNTLGLPGGIYNLKTTIYNPSDMDSSDNSIEKVVTLGPPTQLSVTAWTDKSSYPDGNIVKLSALVKDDQGVGVSGCTVNYSVSSGSYTYNGALSEIGGGNYYIEFMSPEKPGNYYILVTAIRTGNLPGNFQISFAVLDKRPPSIPILSSPGDNQTVSGSPAFDWSESVDFGSGIAGYKIQISKNIDFSILEKDLQTISSDLSTTLNPGTYYWRVRSIDNANNQSDWSAVWKFNLSLSFVTDKDSVAVPEGGTATFQVKLSAQPSSTVSVTVARFSGDTDISVQSGASLTFTTSNWSTYQTVTLSAAEDVDTVNGVATIRVSASGIPNKDITATEADNDTLSFVTDKDSVAVPEGGTATFQVKLSAQPSSTVSVTVARFSGDTDISVQSGASLTFTTSNWNTYQTVTLSAAEDADTVNGAATIRVSASGVPNKDITATEADTTPIPILLVIPSEALSVNEGGSFSASSKQYSISNSGGGAFNWTTSVDQGWVTVSPESGTNSGTVTVSINSNANRLSGSPTGTVYTATVTFGSNGGGTTRQVSLTIYKMMPGVTQLSKSGQNKCYESLGNEIDCSGTEQDGEIQAGVTWPEPRFTNADGTAPITGDVVIDQLTGLMWARDAGTPTVEACTGGAKTWQDALDYVSCLNSNNYLGYSDWRLPNINERESLINSGESKTSDWLNTQGFINAQEYFYWSSTSLNIDLAWSIYLRDGYMSIWDGYKIDKKNYVWVVRGITSGPAKVWKTGQIISYLAGDDGDFETGISPPIPRFESDGDTTVIDKLTGLIWAPDAGTPDFGTCTGGSKTWQEALDYVSCLNNNNYLGHNDWRLPNRKELYSLIDYSRYDPCLPVDHLSTNIQFSYWSSTSSSLTGYTYFKRYIYFTGPCGVSDDPNSANHYAWPVRTGNVPIGVIASDGQYTDRVRVTWGSMAGAMEYQVWRNTVNDSVSAAPVSAWVDGTSWDDPTAVVGVTYHYWVKARNNYGESGYGAPDAGFCAGTAPSAPRDVEATDGVYPDRVRITWSGSSEAGEYQVWRSTINDTSSASAISDWQAELSFNDMTVPEVEPVYFYWVKARNVWGESGFSTVDTGFRVGTLNSPTLAAPSDGASGQATTVNLQWKDTNSAPEDQGYRVRIRPSGGSYSNYSTAPNAISYPLSGLSSNTTYYWNVQAVGNGTSTLDSAWANSGNDWTFTTVCPTLGAPSLISPSGSEVSMTPALDWGDVTGASTYDVEVCDDSGCSSVVRQHGALPSSQWVVSPVLAQGTQYWWRARANNACGAGAWPITPLGFTTVSSPTITTSSPLPSGTVNTAYSQTLQATGGSTPYSWSIPSGSLPPGLSLTSSTAVISGTPTTANLYNFRIRVTGSNSLYSEKDFSLTINPVDTIPLLAPTGLQILQSNFGWIKLAWNPNNESDLAGYKVYYGDSSGTYTKLIDVGKVTSFTLTGLALGQTYFIAITSYDKLGNESDKSNEVNGASTMIMNQWTGIGPEGGTVRTFTINPIDSNIIYAGTWGGGVFKSIDGGFSWERTGLSNVDVRALCIDSLNPGVLYAGTNGIGAFKSTDGGTTWSPINTGLSNPYVYALAIDPQNPDVLYAGAGSMFKSTNGGETWNAINTGLTYFSVQVLTIDPQNPNILYAGTWGGRDIQERRWWEFLE